MPVPTMTSFHLQLVINFTQTHCCASDYCVVSAILADWQPADHCRLLEIAQRHTALETKRSCCGRRYTAGMQAYRAGTTTADCAVSS